MNDIGKYWNALTYMALYHGDQKRKSGNIAYIIHPIRITYILRAAGFSELEHEDLMIAALFHDLIEDTQITFEKIEEDFGTSIASIVQELSKPKNLDKTEWLKNFGKKSKEARIIKLADRIDNLMDTTGTNWSNKKKDSYAEEGKIILMQCANTHTELEKKLEEAIQAILNA